MIRVRLCRHCLRTLNMAQAVEHEAQGHLVDYVTLKRRHRGRRRRDYQWSSDWKPE